MLGYLDAAQDRITETGQRRWDEQVEAVLTGTVLAHDGKQLRKWRTRRAKSATDPRRAAASLERQIAALAATHPEYVVSG